jgi:AAA family ATP:ADP antiporter
MSSGFLERVLGLEKRERVAVTWSFAYFFCVLSSYYMLRPVREAMGVESGTESIPFLFTSTFFVMLLASPVFGWVASRYPRRTFLPWVYAFFAVNILFFYAAFIWADSAGHGILWVGRVFFVWVSVFNLFVVSVFWSFMADIYTKEQGRRLFGVISAGGSAGALVGPFLTSLLVHPLGFENLLPLSALLLFAAILCIRKLRAWVEREHAGGINESAAAAKPLGGSAFAGITHVLNSRYFLAMTAMSIIASLLGTALYMFMNTLVAESIEGVNARTRLFGYLDAGTNLLSLLFSLLVVRHAVLKFGLGLTLALMPLLSIAGFALRSRFRLRQARERHAVFGRVTGGKVQGQEFHRYRRVSRQRSCRHLGSACGVGTWYHRHLPAHAAVCATMGWNCRVARARVPAPG